MTRLRVLPATGDAFDFDMSGESLTIGRSSSADLSLADRFLSRHHARLFNQDDQLFVEDLGSRNGTYVNGKQIDGSVAVGPGDEIRISSSSIILDAGEGRNTAETRQRTTSELFGEGTVLRRADELLASNRDSDVSSMGDEEELRRYAERLKLLNQVHQALAHSVALDDLLDLILDRAFDHLRPEEGAIYLRSSDGSLERAASRTVHPGQGPLLYSQTLIHEVTDKRLAALVLDAQADERFAHAASILSSGIRSLIAAPFLDQEQALGMIVLGSRVHVRQFTEEDLELLASLAAVAGLRLRNVSLAEEAAERRRMERELALARRIQVALLPTALPDIPGYEIYGGNIPSQTVSGDYYEMIERDEGRELLVMLADVSGKGISAALLTVCIEALAADPIATGVPPADIFRRVSRELHRRTPLEKYATAFLVALQPASGEITYANAGHNPAIIVRRDGTVELLGATGMPIGLLPTNEYEARTVELASGDLLALYTDGITEPTNPEQEEYGTDRLAAAIVANRELPLAELATKLEEDLGRFVSGVPYADDRTMVLLRRSE